MTSRCLLLSSLVCTTGCAGAGVGLPGTGAMHAATRSTHRSDGALRPVKHVIVIIQENRSLDNLFQGFPGARTQRFGVNHLGQHLLLVQTPLQSGFQPGHGHNTFVTESDYDPSTGRYRMDGFDLSGGKCTAGQPCTPSVYTYVQQSDVANYWTLAHQYALGDMTFQPNMGASFTAHQYLIAGQSGGYDSDALAFYADPVNGGTTCATPKAKVPTLDMTTAYPGVRAMPKPTCATYRTIFDELDAAHLTWRYYARSAVGYWTAPNTIESLYTNDPANVSVPETNVLTDIANHALPAVAYVTPADSFSDHPFPSLTNHGQDWIALIANAVGSDPAYWNNTVIIVTWDDWGGFYDHVPPPFAFNPAGGNPDPNEYSFRVPLLVVGAFVKPGTVDHTVRSSVAAITFIEKVFGLPSLGTLDAQNDSLMSLFDFAKPPNAYQPLPTHGFSPSAARAAALRGGPPDDDMP